jgi:hypothetical protein
MDNSDKKHDIASEAQQLTEKVDKALASGSISQAKRAFIQNWREAVPELPLRFSVILEDLNLENVYELLKMKRKDKMPQLKLQIVKNRTAVQMVRGRKLIIGFLPKRDSSLLDQLGDKAFKLYQPRILEAPRKDDGSLAYLAVELVRPESNICSSCGKKHSDPQANCSDCRKKRKKIGQTSFEHTPISVQEAFEEVNQSTDKDDLPF